MKTKRATHNGSNEPSGALIELTSADSTREFEYHGSWFDATVTAEETGNNSDTMRIRLLATGQECGGNVVVEGCWERTEFFAFMRTLARALGEGPSDTKGAL